MTQVRLHGLSLRSAVELEATPDTTGASPAFILRRGAARSCVGRPGPEAGTLIAALSPGGVDSWIAENRGRWLIRYERLVDFEVVGASVTAHPHHGAPEGMIGILFAGSVLSRLLVDRGFTVLHAGAVEIEGHGVAVVGPSGAGKSTTVSHLCSAGFPLVTDDTLAVEHRGESGRPRCFRGTPTLRLRLSARDRLGATVAGWVTKSSVDGRLLARPPLTSKDVLPLTAILLLRRVQRQPDVQLKPLTGSRAVYAIASNARAAGWLDRGRGALEFQRAAALASVVDVFDAVVPAEAAGAELAGALVPQLHDVLV